MKKYSPFPGPDYTAIEGLQAKDPDLENPGAIGTDGEIGAKGKIRMSGYIRTRKSQEVWDLIYSKNSSSEVF